MYDTVSELIALNQTIRAGALFDNHPGRNSSEDLFKNLRHFGFAPADVMVLSICPDGDDTIIGAFRTREGETYSFDFDLEDVSQSRLLNESASGRGRWAKSKRTKLFQEDIDQAIARWFEDR